MKAVRVHDCHETPRVALNTPTYALDAAADALAYLDQARLPGSYAVLVPARTT